MMVLCLIWALAALATMKKFSHGYDLVLHYVVKYLQKQLYDFHIMYMM